MQNTLKQIWVLLQPSWFSGLVAGFLSFGVIVATVIISNFQGSSLQQEIFEAKAGHASDSVINFKAVTDNLASNSFISNLPLFLFWAALGVIVYLFATGLWGGLSKAEELREELEYVNAPREKLLKEGFISMLIRMLCLGLWIGYLEVFLKVLLPYALAAAHVAAVNLASFTGIGYVLLAFAVLFVALQLHVVFMRLVWLRLRVFGETA